MPVPAVSYNYFNNIVSKCDLKFKDLSPDQCAKCMQYMAQIKKAAPNDKDVLRETWEQHKRQADVGYLYRAARKKESKELWRGVVLPLWVPASFPPPATPLPGIHSDKHDFTECDMGGGRRTPLIKQGPQSVLPKDSTFKTLLHLLYGPWGRSVLVERANWGVRSRRYL